MIEVMVEKNCGAARAKARVRAASIERALHLAGEGARLVLPNNDDSAVLVVRLAVRARPGNRRPATGRPPGRRHTRVVRPPVLADRADRG